MTRSISLGLLALPLAFVSPALANCKTDISTFQKLLDNDLKVGHVGKSVHAKASADLAAAGKLCSASQDGAASNAVRAARSRYGYPTN